MQVAQTLRQALAADFKPWLRMKIKARRVAAKLPRKLADQASKTHRVEALRVHHSHPLWDADGVVGPHPSFALVVRYLK
jgi:hypothetical protein